jgi:hypothetical protein
MFCSAWLLACGGGGNEAEPTTQTDASSIHAQSADAGLDGGAYALTGEVGPVEGSGAMCSSTSDARDAGRCYGHLCGTNGNSIKAALAPQSPCATDPEVWLICDGSGAREATSCARSHALDAEPRSGTRACIEANPTLQPFSTGCVDCFLDAVDCARTHCLTECLAGDNPGCDQCQEEQGCTAAFFACSGLPNPK